MTLILSSRGLWVNRQNCRAYSWLGPNVAWISRIPWSSKQHSLQKQNWEVNCTCSVNSQEKKTCILKVPSVHPKFPQKSVKGTRISCDKSECLLKAQLSRSSTLLSCNFSFLSFPATQPPLLPLCFLFHFLAPAPAGKQRSWIFCSQSPGLSELKTRWEGRGFWASRAVSK